MGKGHVVSDVYIGSEMPLVAQVQAIYDYLVWVKRGQSVELAALGALMENIAIYQEDNKEQKA